MQQPKEELTLHFIKSTLFILDLRVACPNRASLALYKCNGKANVTPELCVAMLACTKKQPASLRRTPSQREEESKAEMKNFIWERKTREKDISPDRMI